MSLTAAPRIGSIAVALVDASRLAIATLISALHAHALAIEILVTHVLEVITSTSTSLQEVQFQHCFQLFFGAAAAAGAYPSAPSAKTKRNM